MNRETDRRIRVALLDDHPVVLYGLSAQLAQVPDMSMAGSFETSREMLAALARQEVDVLLMDYSLGATEIDGIGLLRMLRLRFPSLEILVLSGHANPATAALALRAGARGFVGKMRPMHEVLEAIRTVAARKRYIDTTMAYQFDQSQKNAVAEDAATGATMLATQASLSTREREVLRCVLDGMAVTAIAAKFSRSVNTISTQKQAAYRKLGIRSSRFSIA
jgi:two-component system, NarL family, captular synthesis response regulator RcsB